MQKASINTRKMIDNIKQLYRDLDLDLKTQAIKTIADYMGVTENTVRVQYLYRGAIPEAKQEACVTILQLFHRAQNQRVIATNNVLKDFK
jgi:hypothetical protein